MRTKNKQRHQDGHRWQIVLMQSLRLKLGQNFVVQDSGDETECKQCSSIEYVSLDAKSLKVKWKRKRKK